MFIFTRNSCVFIIVYLFPFVADFLMLGRHAGVTHDTILLSVNDCKTAVLIVCLDFNFKS